MYALVADVRRYPEFIPWILAVRVRSDSETEMLADCIVGYKGLRESFTSRVHKQPVSRIHVDYVDGPLRHLHNEWGFADAPDGGCIVDFTVEFTFRNSLFERMATQLFDAGVRRLTQAFEDRAAALYGSNSSSATSVA